MVGVYVGPNWLLAEGHHAIQFVRAGPLSTRASRTLAKLEA